MQNKYTIKMFQRALRDLDSIYQYIYEQVPEYAEEQADRLEAGIFSLEEYPYRCAERKTGRYANRGYRELIVDSYIIIYKIHARKKEVDIVRCSMGKEIFRVAYKVLH